MFGKNRELIDFIVSHYPWMQRELDSIADSSSRTNFILAEIESKLDHLLVLLAKPVKAKIIFKQGETIVPGTMTDNQTITASIAETDAAGANVTVQDASKVTWVVGDATVATVSVDASTGIATFAPASPLPTLPAQTQVSVTDGTTGLSAQDTLSITAGAATNLVIKFGTPADKAPATPAPSA